MLGTTPPPRALGDLTNTPSPVSLRTFTPPATSVQRFSLRSRRALATRPHPYGARGAPPGKLPHEQLTIPPSVVGCTGEGLVRICPCSWQRALIPSNARLCQRDTEEHAEFLLLEAMGRRYREEVGGALPSSRRHRPPPGEGANVPSVAGRAALQQLEVHFILQPSADTNTVVGYAAFCPEDELHPERRELYQLYVEPEFRRQGVATAALGVLLARRTALLVAGDDEEQLSAAQPAQRRHGGDAGGGHAASPAREAWEEAEEEEGDDGAAAHFGGINLFGPSSGGHTSRRLVGPAAVKGVLRRLGFQPQAQADGRVGNAGRLLHVRSAQQYSGDTSENMR